VLTVCAHYSETRSRIALEVNGDVAANAVADAVVGANSQINGNATASTPTGTASLTLVVPISINSSNLWGIQADIRVGAFYSGNRAAALARGAIEGFALVPQGTTRFDVEMTLPEAEASQASNLYDYLVRRCGPFVSSGTWFLDLHIQAAAYGVEAEFWIEDVELPCVGVGVEASPIGMLRNVTNATSLDDCAAEALRNAARVDGQYCKTLLCAVDDLMCERLEENACGQSGGTSTSGGGSGDGSAAPLPRPPAAPPPLVDAPSTLGSQGDDALPSGSPGTPATLPPPAAPPTLLPPAAPPTLLNGVIG